MINIKIYTTPTCGFCKMAKEYLKSKNLAYEEYDVSTDAAKRQEMIEITGQIGVPVIIIGQGLILGFDKKAIDEALAAAKSEV